MVLTDIPIEVLKKDMDDLEEEEEDIHEERIKEHTKKENIKITDNSKHSYY